MPSSNPLAEMFYGNTSSFNDEEFGLFFKVNKKGDFYRWELKKTVIQDCNRLYFLLPNYPQSLDKFIKLVVGNGIMLRDKNGQLSKDNKNPDFVEFLSTFREGDISYLWEMMRLIMYKGNFFDNLVTLDEATNRLAWDLYPPERIMIETKSPNPMTAKNTVENYYYLPRKGKPILIEKPENLISCKANPSGVFGVPPILFNVNFSNAIIADIKKFAQAKNTGAFKKQLQSPLKVEVSGDGLKKYRKLSSDELEQLSSDINQSLNDATQSVHVIDVELTPSEIAPVEPDTDFILLMGDTYARHISALTKIAPYMVVNKEPNRSVTEQQYKEMIQMQVQPMNNWLTNIIQKKYEIWCQAAGKTPNLKLSLPNPKAFLDASLDGISLLKAASMGLITQDEFRFFAGLEPATDDLKAEFGARNKTQIIK